jgi:L-malate glycosyltransferase
MIVYVGNMLSRHGSSINFMELMVPKLSGYYEIRAASSKKNKFIRLIDMLVCIIGNRKKCEIVLIDTYSTKAFVYATLAARVCRLLSLPYIPILHGGNLPERYQRDTAAVTKFLSGARDIVSPSLYLQVFFSKRGFNVSYIPNFIDINRYTFLSRDQIRPRLLWVRAFQEIYNPMLAVKVLQIVLKSYSSVKLCMVGAAKDHTFEEVAKLIKEFQLEAHVEITGILSKEAWVDMSNGYDIFINTTKIDNMPVSVIEAMALGLPVVSTNVGGIPYLIEHNKTGLLVESGSAAQMAKAILELVNSPILARELSLNARRMVEDFDWANVSLKWFEVLNRIVTKRTES